MLFFFFKQNTAYELRISDWSSDVCSSDLHAQHPVLALQRNVNIGRDVICHQCGNSNAEIDVVAVTQLARGTRSHLVAGPSTRHTSSSRRRDVRFSTLPSLMLDRSTRSKKIPGVWMLLVTSSPAGTYSLNSANRKSEVY